MSSVDRTSLVRFIHLSEPQFGLCAWCGVFDTGVYLGVGLGSEERRRVPYWAPPPTPKRKKEILSSLQTKELRRGPVITLVVTSDLMMLKFTLFNRSWNQSELLRMYYRYIIACPHVVSLWSNDVSVVNIPASTPLSFRKKEVRNWPINSYFGSKTFTEYSRMYCKGCPRSSKITTMINVTVNFLVLIFYIIKI